MSDYRISDFTRGYRFHRKLGKVVSSNPEEDQPLGRFVSLKRAWHDFRFRGPALRRDDRVKYGTGAES